MPQNLKKTNSSLNPSIPRSSTVPIIPIIDQYFQKRMNKNGYRDTKETNNLFKLSIFFFDESRRKGTRQIIILPASIDTRHFQKSKQPYKCHNFFIHLFCVNIYLLFLFILITLLVAVNHHQFLLPIVSFRTRAEMSSMFTVMLVSVEK